MIGSRFVVRRSSGRRARVVGELRLDRLMDVAVDAVGAEGCHDPVGVEHVEHLRLDAREAQRDAVRLRDLVELGQLRGALGVDEVDALEVEHDRVQSRLARRG